MADQVASLFWAKVIVLGLDECWPWTASTHKNGYGKFGSAYRFVTDRAHRVAYMLTRGVQLTKEEHVCHSCDNRLCSNPTHLFVGTAAENITDKTLKNRQAKGIGHGMHKLTEAQVLEIRNSQFSQRAIAKVYGISQTLVCYIKAGKSWKHL